MSKLDAVIDRLKALPEEEQARLAREIEGLLEERSDAVALTPAQWDELDRRLAGDRSDGEPHDAVMREMKQRFGL